MPLTGDNQSSPGQDSSKNDTNDNNKKDGNIETVIKKVLTLALNKFEDGNNAQRQSINERDIQSSQATSTQPPSQTRATNTDRALDNDLTKVVIGQVAQFAVKRYLKSREKKRLTKAREAAASKSKVKSARSLPKEAHPLPTTAAGGVAAGATAGAAAATTTADMPFFGWSPGGDKSAGDNYYYPGPPPSSRRSRLERRLERERERVEQQRLETERLERIVREKREARRQARERDRERQDIPYRDFPDPVDPVSHRRRVPREPLPRSTPPKVSTSASFISGDRDLPADFARAKRAFKRRAETFSGTRPPESRSRWARFFPDERDDTVRAEPPPPHPFAWESVPVYPPRGASRERRSRERSGGADRERSSREGSRDRKSRPYPPADLPTPPISPKKESSREASSKQIPTYYDPSPLPPPTPYLDDLRRALDDLLVQLQRTDNAVYRAVFPRHHHHGHGRHDHYSSDGRLRRSILLHASGLQRSIARTTDEARSMLDVVGGEFRIQTGGLGDRDGKRKR